MIKRQRDMSHAVQAPSLSAKVKKAQGHALSALNSGLVRA